MLLTSPTGRATRRSVAVILAAGLATISAGMLAAPASATTVYSTLAAFAGTGAGGAPTPGPATSSPMWNSAAVAVDPSGNAYIANTNDYSIEKVSPAGTLSIFAGDGALSSPTPGPATQSSVGFPAALATDSDGNVYSVDQFSDVVEKITPDGTLTVIAGTGSAGAPTPGPATSSALHHPTSVAVDSAGNLYIGDCSNNRIERVNSAGTLSVFAGTGSSSSAVPGPATSSPMVCPAALAIDGHDNVFVADDNSQVSKITPTGTLSFAVGNGTSYAPPVPGPATLSPLGYIQGLSFDDRGDLYLADTGNNLIEEVDAAGDLSVVAGTGGGNTPTIGAAALATDLTPNSVTYDRTRGALLIPDSYDRFVYQIGVTAEPGQPLSLTGTSADKSISISFSAPADHGYPLTGYDISLDGGATWSALTYTSAGGTVSATVAGLTNGHTYPVLVRARNVLGTGVASAAVSLTPAGPAPAPTLTVTSPSNHSTLRAGHSRPTISGAHGVAGDSIAISDGGGQICVTRVRSDGTWQCTPAKALATGTHTLTIRESGAGGQVVATTTLSLVVDAPARIAGGSGAGSGATLANTGSRPGALALIAVGTILAGAAMTGIARRRVPRGC